MPSSTPLRSSPVDTLILEIFSNAHWAFYHASSLCRPQQPCTRTVFASLTRRSLFLRAKIVLYLGGFFNFFRESLALGFESGPHAALRAGVSVSLYNSQSVARQPSLAPLLISSCSTNTKDTHTSSTLPSHHLPSTEKPGQAASASSAL